MLKKNLLKFTLVCAFGIFGNLTHAQTWNDYGNKIYGTANFDGFGTSLSLTSNGQFIASGTSFGGNLTDQGYIKVHQMLNNVWVQVGQTIDGNTAGSYCGRSAKLIGSDLSNLKLAVGYADYSGNTQGEARVFELNTSTQQWEQIGQTISGEAANDNFGAAISMSADGNTLAVGGDFNDGQNAADCGHVRVYTFDQGMWNLETEIDGLSAGDRSGSSLDLSADGNVLAIGAPYSSIAAGQGGNVRVFRKNGNVWSQTGITLSSDVFGAEFGKSVGLSADGSRLVVGCPFGNDVSDLPVGYGVVFEFNQTDYTELSERFYGDNSFYVAGMSVAISADGKTVIIGSSEDSNQSWLAGSASIYREGTTNWSIVDQQIEANAYAGLYGRYVSISGDGNIVAIGSPASFENDPLADGEGLVHLLKLSSSVGLKETSEMNFKVSAFPNPFTHNLKIEAESDYTFSLYDIHGKSIKDAVRYGSGTNTLDLGDLPAGSYLGVFSGTDGHVNRVSLVKQ